ncbi:MAG: transposase [Lysobacterales bacterium]
MPDQVYLLTFCTMDRYPWFCTPTFASGFSRILSLDATWPSARALAWVLMPDHWHGLVEIDGREPLGRVVARVKGLATHVFPSSQRHRIWQRTFHDHALRSDESTLAVGRYILANPVRAGLAARIDQWPWRGGILLNAIEAELPLALP